MISSSETRFAKYKEEMEMNLSGLIAKNEIKKEAEITAIGEDVRNYIPSLEDQDVNNFFIIDGKLYYTGNDEMQGEIANNQKIEVLSAENGLDKAEKSIEKKKMDKITESLENEVDYRLKSRINATQPWKIVVEVRNNETVETYGDGCLYIPKGENIEGIGVLKQGYIIKDGKNIVFDESIHTYLSNLTVQLANSSDIVLNVDPLNLSDYGNWGSGVTLYGVSSQDFSNFYDGKKLTFDGVDDYIEINMNSVDTSKGITLEFYGKVLNGSSGILNKTVRDPEEEGQKYTQRFRTSIGINSTSGVKLWKCCMGPGDSGCVWESGQNAKHWIQKQIEYDGSNYQADYITFLMDCVKNELTLYHNGEKIGTASCRHDWMVSGGLDDSTIPFTIGLQIGGTSYTEVFANMELYSCRLYSNILSDKQVQDNYNATVAYHNLLVEEANQSNSGT